MYTHALTLLPKPECNPFAALPDIKGLRSDLSELHIIDMFGEEAILYNCHFFDSNEKTVGIICFDGIESVTLTSKHKYYFTRLKKILRKTLMTKK